MEKITSLEDFVHRSWHLLFQATVKRRQPFAAPVVGTVRERQCRMRTVILRRVEIRERRLIFFSDARSSKVEDLAAGSSLSWHFYDPRRQLQIRAGGLAATHHQDELARRFWEDQPAVSRKNYASLRPPGTILEAAGDGLPAFWGDDLPAEETDFAFAHFLVVAGTIDYMDCLQLHPEGHRRAVFRWEQEQWKGHWVLP